MKYTGYVSLVALSLVAVVFFGRTDNVWAASYDVTAAVPFPVSTQPPAPNPALAGFNTPNATATITGTCQIIAPSGIVSIWRNGLLIGSGLCNASGAFSIQVTLTQGLNTLTTRMSNIDNVYGPDAAAFSMTYTPASSPTAQPNTAEEAPQLTTDTPVVVASETNEIQVSFVIGGGNAPYELTINWGDGVVEVKRFDQPGTYVLAHTYVEAKSYAITAVVKDVLGVTTTLQLPVVHISAATAPKEVAQTQDGDVTEENVVYRDNGRFGKWYEKAAIIFLPLITYPLGRRHGFHRAKRVVEGSKKEQ